MLGLLFGPVIAQAATRVEVPIFEGGAGLDFFFFAAREYEKVRPDVQVDLYGDPRIADKVRVRILEGSFPEVSNAGLNYWSLIRNGEILSLDDYLDGPSWDGDRTWRASFLPGSLDRYEYEGKIYAFPSSIRSMPSGTTRTCSKSTAGHRRALGTSFSPFASKSAQQEFGRWPFRGVIQAISAA